MKVGEMKVGVMNVGLMNVGKQIWSPLSDQTEAKNFKTFFDENRT